VRDGEEEPPRVRLRDVEQPCGQLEERGHEQDEDGHPLGGMSERVAEGPPRRAAEESGVDAPQLRQQQRDGRDPGQHVHALGDPVEVYRPGRPAEPGRWVLDEVAGQPGDETQREGRAEP
jgi:hypothetical protein